MTATAQEPISKEMLAKMRKCAIFLGEPGNEVAIQLLDEIDRRAKLQPRVRLRFDDEFLMIEAYWVHDMTEDMEEEILLIGVDLDESMTAEENIAMMTDWAEKQGFRVVGEDED